MLCCSQVWMNKSSSPFFPGCPTLTWTSNKYGVDFVGLSCQVSKKHLAGHLQQMFRKYFTRFYELKSFTNLILHLKTHCCPCRLYSNRQANIALFLFPQWCTSVQSARRNGDFRAMPPSDRCHHLATPKVALRQLNLSGVGLLFF